MYRTEIFNYPVSHLFSSPLFRFFAAQLLKILNKMKKLKWLVLFMILTAPVIAQDFPGYRAGNYMGVNGVFFNPANIADSRYRWDLNLFSLNLSVANSKASFKLKDIGESFNGDSLKNQLFGKNAGPTSALMSVNVAGPSVMFNAGKKTAFALTTRARTMVNIKNLDGKLADQLINDDIDGLPYNISSNQNQIVSIHGWTEFGLSMGRVLADKGKHFLKGGISVKYLAGAANGYININNLNGTLDHDLIDPEEVYLRDASGGLEIGVGGVRLNDFKADDLLSFESTGFGGDIGFVYEFRPACETAGSMGRDENKYKFRIGAALLDFGKIKYKKDPASSGGYNIAISGSERFYLSELDGVNPDRYDSVFAANPTLFTSTSANVGDIKVSLPTTLQLDVDYHFCRGFYLNLAGQLALSKMDSKPYNSQYYNSFSVTPRFEGRAFGLYVPVNYNELSKLNAGVSLRMGPLFVGSGSVLTALFGESKQVDMHFGLRFGGLQKKKK